MDKCREQFEAWAINTKDQFGVPFFTIKKDDGTYVDHGTEISWQAWQASRQALVVKNAAEAKPNKEIKKCVEKLRCSKVTYKNAPKQN